MNLTSSEIVLLILILLLSCIILFLVWKKAWASFKKIFFKVFVYLYNKVVIVFKKGILWIGRSSLKLYNILDKSKENEVRPIGAMTPTNNAENVSVYEQKLEAGISDKGIINVALAGPYGSGKTSIIKTFFRHHPHYKPLIVSLAAFKDDKKDLSETDDVIVENVAESIKDSNIHTEKDQKLINERIEYSILQQLLYHVSGKEVPFSRFQRIRPISWVKTIGITLFITVIGYASIYSYKKEWAPVLDFPATIMQLFQVSVENPGIKFSWTNIIAGSLVLFGSMVVMALIFRLGRLGLLKLNMQGAEVEISNKKDLSVLNQHLDEIMYFFISTKYDVLVFEDLDRFRNSEIFVKLREISTLVNNSVEVKRKITFIYALRDDVFLDEKRTKFFDFIIPVVPIINSTNSATELINKFKELKLDKSIPESFLNDLSLFITDKRLIETIVNEFDVYRTQLATPELDNRILLALIVYKNMHPTDFSKLQTNKGMLYELFLMRQSLIREKRLEIEQDINQRTLKIQDLEKKHLKSLRELRLCYLSVFFQNAFINTQSDLSGNLDLNGAQYSITELVEDNLFKLIQTNNKFQFRYSRSAYATIVHVYFSEVEKLVDSEQSYLQREEKLVNILSTDSSIERGEIGRLKEHLIRLNGYTLKEILKIKPLSEIATPIKQYPALAYLVGNGYITEDYRYYLSHFKPGQLEKEDREFLLSLKAQQSKAWDHTLHKVNKVVEWVTETECTEAGILNFDLVKFLISSNHFAPHKLELIVKQLAELRQNEFEFIHQFGRKFPEHFGELLAFVIPFNSSFWNYISANSQLSLEDKLGYLRVIFENCSLKDIEGLNQDGKLAESISRDAYFLILKDERRIQKLKTLLDKFQIKFEVVPDSSEVSSEIIDYVFDRSYYVLSPEMVEYVIGKKGDASGVNLKSGQLTYILNGDLNQFKRYVLDNLEIYITDVYFLNKSHEHESIETVLTVLLNESISEEVKRRFIKETAFQLDDISKIPKEFYNDFLVYDRILPTWHNVLTYLIANATVDVEGATIRSFSQELFDWVSKEKNLKKLSEMKLDEWQEGDPSELGGYQDCVLALVNNQILAFNVRRQLANSIEFKISSISSDDLSNDMLDILMPKMTYNEETAIAISNVDFRKFIQFTLQNWSEFETISDKIELSDGEITELYEANLTSTQKLFLYPQMSKNAITLLLQKGVKIPKEVLQLPKFALSADELQAASVNMDAETIVSAIIANIETLTEENVVELLDGLGGHYKKLAQKKGKEVDKSESMEALITSLHEQGFLIASFESKRSIIEIKFTSDANNLN